MSKLNHDKRALEEAFFQAEDKLLIEKLRKMRQLEETKENLAAVSGITNEALLDKLVRLDIKAETLASLAVIPLIEVAWADGSIDPKERLAITKSLQTAQFAQNIDRELVEHWLTKKPEPNLLDAWLHYASDLCAELNTAERQTIKEELIGHARLVAEASGGFLGVGSVSASEKAMLEKLTQVFDSV